MFANFFAHVGANRWLWTGILVAVAAAAYLLRQAFGTGYHFGDIMALALMSIGTLVILQSQQDYHPPRMEIGGTEGQ